MGRWREGGGGGRMMASSVVVAPECARHLCFCGCVTHKYLKQKRHLFLLSINQKDRRTREYVSLATPADTKRTPRVLPNAHQVELRAKK